MFGSESNMFTSLAAISLVVYFLRLINSVYLAFKIYLTKRVHLSCIETNLIKATLISINKMH
jgi:hypothetical protein